MSDYFRTKHVVNHRHVRRQLLSPNIPDARKVSILESYLNKPVKFQPDPLNPPAIGTPKPKPWRTLLSAKSGTTLILADQRKITTAVRNGNLIGVDSKSNPVVETKVKLPMIKVQPKHVNKKFSHLHFPDTPNSRTPVVKHDPLRVSFTNGLVNHFESLIKPIRKG